MPLETKHRINLCILTYKRTEILRKCLNSLEEMTVPEGVDLMVTVIENDPDQESRQLVQSKIKADRLQLFYLYEPIRGIPVARNSAINFSQSHNCDYIAFIDDDEWVQRDWLDKLYGYCQQKGGRAVISGKVVPVLPPNTPKQISGLIEPKSRPTATRLTACATNNVLMPIYLSQDLNLRFDESVPLAGGTDTKFFVAARTKGVEIFFCEEAIVYEEIPEARTKLSWLGQRKYRAGITVAWRRIQIGKSTTRINISALSALTVNTLKMCIFALIGSPLRRNKAYLRYKKAQGLLAGLKGMEVESYKFPE